MPSATPALFAALPTLLPPPSSPPSHQLDEYVNDVVDLEAKYLAVCASLEAGVKKLLPAIPQRACQSPLNVFKSALHHDHTKRPTIGEMRQVCTPPPPPPPSPLLIPLQSIENALQLTLDPRGEKPKANTDLETRIAQIGYAHHRVLIPTSAGSSPPYPSLLPSLSLPFSHLPPSRA